MKKLMPILLITVIFLFQEAVSQNAPISTIGVAETYGTSVVVPITVTGFTGIGSCELFLSFDPDIATISSVTLGAGVSSFYFLHGEIEPGVYKIVWLFFQFGVPGLTLPDNSVFMNINVEKAANGFSPIEFIHNPPDQLTFYTDGNFDPVNDDPISSYYFNGPVTFASGATQWTGNIDDDWSNPLNWDAGVPGATSAAIINDVSPNPFPSASVNAECLGLTIGSGAGLTVPGGSTLTVHGNFQNNGQFTVESNAGGDGSFINYGAISGSGTSTVERYLTSEMWHYVSPPISDGLSGIFLGIYMMEWYEITGEWSFIVPVNVPLIPMKGYGVWADDDFTGTTTVLYQTSAPNLNAGAFTSSSLTSYGPFDPVAGNRGFNFVGNPYPSAIDWDEMSGWNKTTLANAIYIWNPSAGQYGSYVNGSSTNSVTNIIPGGQGFFVHNPVDFTTASLTVNNNARVHSNKPFFKSNESEKQSIKLFISSDINMYSDELIVSFNESATQDFDPFYDALNLRGNEEAPDIYSVSADLRNLSINACSPLIENATIPVSCKVGINGFYTITMSDLINFDAATQILLEDKFENLFIDLNIQDSYSFFATTSDVTERFNLHFLLDPVSTIEIGNNPNVLIYAADNTIHIKRDDSELLNGSLKVYDLLGRLVLTNDILSISQCLVPIHEKGVYIVNYFDHTEQKAYQQKIVLQ